VTQSWKGSMSAAAILGAARRTVSSGGSSSIAFLPPERRRQADWLATGGDASGAARPSAKGASRRR
jgi:hypothetical protein